MSFARTDRNSFLEYKVSSTSELVNQVQTNPAVLGRYERYYAKSGPEIIAYFKTLHIGYLQSDAVYRVFSIPPSGYVKVHNQKLQRGLRVFLDPSNKPVLVWLCGNPLTGNDSYMPKSGAAMSPMAPTPATVSLTAPTTVQVMPPMAEALAPSVPPIPNLPAVVQPEVPVTVLVPPPAGGGGLSALAAIPAFAGIWLAHSGGGGTTQAVPEPSALIALAVPALGLLLRRRRR